MANNKLLKSKFQRKQPVAGFTQRREGKNQKKNSSSRPSFRFRPFELSFRRRPESRRVPPNPALKYALCYAIVFYSLRKVEILSVKSINNLDLMPLSQANSKVLAIARGFFLRFPALP